MLDRVTIQYGNDSGTTYNGQVTILSDDVTIRNSIIRDGKEAGLYVRNASPTLIGNQLLNNRHGLYNYNTTTDDTSLSVQGHTFSGNTDYGIYNYSSSQQIDARFSFWGDPSGPQHTDNPDGNGDRVSGYVLFDSWTEEESTSCNLFNAILFLKVLAGSADSLSVDADINGDGKISLEDVIHILRKISEMRQ